MSKRSLKSFEELYVAKHTEQVRAGSAEAEGPPVKAYEHHSVGETCATCREGKGQ